MSIIQLKSFFIFRIVTSSELQQNRYYISLISLKQVNQVELVSYIFFILYCRYMVYNTAVSNPNQHKIWQNVNLRKILFYYLNCIFMFNILIKLIIKIMRFF